MVTNPLKRWARYILRKELGALKESLSAFAADNTRLSNKMSYAMGEYSRIRNLNRNLSQWADAVASRTDGGETQSRMLFIRDMLDHGPDGPWNNTHGVHPADRWNIQSFKHRDKAKWPRGEI